MIIFAGLAAAHRLCSIYSQEQSDILELLPLNAEHTILFLMWKCFTLGQLLYFIFKREITATHPSQLHARQVWTLQCLQRLLNKNEGSIIISIVVLIHVLSWMDWNQLDTIRRPRPDQWQWSTVPKDSVNMLYLSRLIEWGLHGLTVASSSPHS